MPTYQYKCQKCGQIFEDIRTISTRNDIGTCPVETCGGSVIRDTESEFAKPMVWVPEHERLSKSMGVNPEQIKEAEKNFPGSKYAPNGDLIIRSRQHKLSEMKRRGMIEL